MTEPKDTDAATPARQPALNWRFEFATYGATRDFLDLLADLSKRDGYYPNINFGKTYVNVSIDAEGQAELGERASAFVAEMKAHAAQGQI
jgi:pterin-4a-carbinolamine dehydratase